jgi:hypothetical protein
MPPSLTEEVSRILLKSGANIPALMTSLNGAADSRVPSRELVKENCGRLAADIVMEAHRLGVSPRDFELRGIVFPGVSLANAHIANSKWEDVEFKRVDFRGTQIEGCTAVNCVLDSPLIDSQTMLDLIGLDAHTDVRGVRFSESAGVRTIFEPGEVGRVLRNAKLPSAQDLGSVALRSVNPKVVETLESYVRASSRSNPLCVRDNAFGFEPDKDVWEEIAKIGAATHVFRIEYRQTRGPKIPFIRRLFRGEAIMAGRVVGADVEAEISDFWNQLVARFPVVK